MDKDNNRRATQVDPGWRNDEPTGKRRATEADPGWRNDEPTGKRRATEADPGWRNDEPTGKRRATEADPGWRREIEDTLNLAKTESKVSANFFSSLEDFKNAVEKLPELRSSVGTAYSVKGTISREGGESVVLLCSDPAGNDVAAKVYYEPLNETDSSISSRSRVLEYMGTEEGKRYTLAVKEIGLVAFGESQYYFEIMPYCKDLADGRVYSFEKLEKITKGFTQWQNANLYSFEELVEVTRQLNEALHSIHQAGIIHMDIKPENLYEFDGRIRLGDFGIAKYGAHGRFGVTVRIYGTEGYAGPETRRYIYNEKSDYYSLGVTLATFFDGHFVFDNMLYGQQAMTQESERLPLIRTDPNREQLENLLDGLCRISSRQRFGYEEVKQWLANHDYTGGGTEEEWPRAFRLLADIYHDEKSMFYGITKNEKHWEEAKEMLYTKTIEQFFRSFRTDLARSAQTADELYRTDNRDKGLAVFLKSLYAPGPIVWRGNTYNSLGELGSRMVVTRTPAAYGELLQNHCISHWLSNTEGISADSDTLRLVDKIEALSATEPEVACYWFGNSFAPVRSLKICGRAVTSFTELLAALFTSANDFYQTDGYQKLLSRADGADLYGFLYSLGYKEIIEKEWEQLASCDLFHKTVILFSMLDHIASREGADPARIRDFFAHYGPVGLAVYIRGLVKKGIYKPLDANGRRMLDEISSFRVPASGSVDELFRACSPLVDSIDKLRGILIDNPHCILTGVYEEKGAICANLTGCFAFRIFERPAPLGFQTWIESSKGGVKK